MELIELQGDLILKQRYLDFGIPNFYDHLPIYQFPKMKMFAAEIIAMFGSTYLCEQMFSLLKNNKTPERSSLTDKHLSAILKIKSSNDIEPNFDLLASKKK